MLFIDYPMNSKVLEILHPSLLYFTLSIKIYGFNYCDG